MSPEIFTVWEFTSVLSIVVQSPEQAPNALEVAYCNCVVAASPDVFHVIVAAFPVRLDVARLVIAGGVVSILKSVAAGGPSEYAPKDTHAEYSLVELFLSL